jgi:very-long-chain enoyl-CoA reductase
VILANLRPPGQKAYVIPRGFLFEFITCPNYTAEILGWLLFTLATSALPALLFGAAGTFQMCQWAVAKHARLLRVPHPLFLTQCTSTTIRI